MNDGNNHVFIQADNLQREAVGEGIGRRILGFDSHIMMTHVEFKKGSIGALHSHPHRQVTYIESGSFLVHIGAEKKVLKSGDCYIVPPHVEHGVVALDDGSLVDVFAPARMDFFNSVV